MYLSEPSVVFQITNKSHDIHANSNNKDILMSAVGDLPAELYQKIKFLTMTSDSGWAFFLTVDFDSTLPKAATVSAVHRRQFVSTHHFYIQSTELAFVWKWVTSLSQFDWNIVRDHSRVAGSLALGSTLRENAEASSSK